MALIVPYVTIWVKSKKGLWIVIKSEQGERFCDGAPRIFRDIRL